MGAVVKGDAGPAVASPENAAVIGRDWTICSSSSCMTHSTSCRALGTQETLHHDCHRRYLVNANLTEVSESTRREHRCPNLPNGRFKLFRRADRDRFKNTRERMGAAVFNGG